MLVYAVLVALAAEVAFALGVALGAAASNFVSLAFNFVTRARRSLVSALLQGVTIGLASGFAGLLVAIWLGRYCGLPESWLLWLAIVPPAIGEFGHWLNRFSLRHLGKPVSGIFMPLGRLHAAAWQFFKSPTFRYYVYAISADHGDCPNEEKYGRDAYKLTLWYLGKAIWGQLVGIAIAIWWLSRVLGLHLWG